MKNSNASSNTDSDPASQPPDLTLPASADFDSSFRRCDTDAFLHLCASLLPQALTAGDFWRLHRDRGVDCEFSLSHPERVTATYPTELIDALLRFAPVTDDEHQTEQDIKRPR